MHELLARKDLGSETWWQALAEQGTPLVGPAQAGQHAVTFVWRDPRGSAATSPTRRVWINITGLTDHHRQCPPQSLARVDGTDLWLWQTHIDANWRGSYSFMPSDDDRDYDGFDAQGNLDLNALRPWWRATFPLAEHDPLNRTRPWTGGRGLGVSGLHMPQAPAHPAWEAVDSGLAAPATLQCHTWNSVRLGNSRRVWLFSTGRDQDPGRPLAVLLDGAFWTGALPLAAPLQTLTDAGQLPHAVYLFVDSIDTAHRSRELACNPAFWLALQEELLPQVQTWQAHARAAATTVVAGQSFGGLASLYAGLQWPQCFGCVLAQSGSFWWPRGEPEQQLPQRVAAGLGQGQALNLFMEAGLREPVIHAANDHMVQALRAAGHHPRYRVVNGGHDALCWRQGLLDGLCALWADLLPAA
ncbi:enterochelin esterase [Pseudomonas sp.]|uniref:enterochelin esterase n=1 Tax=Pseudomonas sp. TaxID=306 RepID=UPI0025885449|nr:enterochelin esterase [Pseudomonas sp.]